MNRNFLLRIDVKILVYFVPEHRHRRLEKLSFSVQRHILWQRDYNISTSDFQLFYFSKHDFFLSNLGPSALFCFFFKFWDSAISKLKKKAKKGAGTEVNFFSKKIQIQVILCKIPEANLKYREQQTRPQHFFTFFYMSRFLVISGR